MGLTSLVSREIVSVDWLAKWHCPERKLEIVVLFVLKCHQDLIIGSERTIIIRCHVINLWHLYMQIYCGLFKFLIRAVFTLVKFILVFLMVCIFFLPP